MTPDWILADIITQKDQINGAHVIPSKADPQILLKMNSGKYYYKSIEIPQHQFVRRQP